MAEVAMSSDQDMLSQTENEDTDAGEDSTNVLNQSTESTCTSDSSLDSTSSTDPAGSSESDNCFRKPMPVSVDLTEVTELEDNTSLNGSDTLSTKSNNNEDKFESRKGFPQLDLPGYWYNQDCFKAYWKHYNQVMSWCSKHYQVMNKLTGQSAKYNTNSTSPTKASKCQTGPGPFSTNFPTWYHPYSNMPSSKTPSKSSETCRKSRRSKKQKHRNLKSETSSCEEIPSETQSDSGEEYQMEITQDMIDFFAKTEEHRKQREEEKRMEKELEEGEQEHVNVEDVKTTDSRAPTKEAPKERPGARRTAEMKLLYGKGAAMIHGMETALQMSFDRNTDLHQPKMWPNMPLRVVFA